MGPPISHLLFADDSIFFARSDERSVTALKDTLQLYCNGSGQKINHDKSSIFFGHHCDVGVKQFVKNLLGVQDEVLQDIYLGMPTDIGRSTTVAFNFLQDKMWKRIMGCSDRPLYRCGKEVFMKSVIQAIPTHIMRCFQISISTCDRMRRAIADFWWGLEEGRRKLHWRSWDWLSAPKFAGGLGF
jgi:hypothetical protein